MSAHVQQRSLRGLQICNLPISAARDFNSTNFSLFLLFKVGDDSPAFPVFSHLLPFCSLISLLCFKCCLVRSSKYIRSNVYAANVAFRHCWLGNRKGIRRPVKKLSDGIVENC